MHVKSCLVPFFVVAMNLIGVATQVFVVVLLLRISRSNSFVDSVFLPWH